MFNKVFSEKKRVEEKVQLWKIAQVANCLQFLFTTREICCLLTSKPLQNNNFFHDFYVQLGGSIE